MGAMRGADFIMGDEELAARKRAPKAAPRGDPKLDVSAAVRFFEEAGEKTYVMSDAVVEFAANAKAMLEGGLTEKALIALMQIDLPRARNGNPFPARDILLVLRAAAGLGAFVNARPAKK